MGDVVAVLQLMPAEDTEFEKLKDAALAVAGKVDKVEEEPIAFGIKALKLTVVVPDGEGGTQSLEEKLAALPEVGDVQVVDLARLL